MVRQREQVGTSEDLGFYPQQDEKSWSGWGRGMT